MNAQYAYRVSAVLQRPGVRPGEFTQQFITVTVSIPFLHLDSTNAWNALEAAVEVNLPDSESIVLGPPARAALHILNQWRVPQDDEPKPPQI